MSQRMQYRDRRGETTIVQVTESAVLREATESGHDPSWRCPHCEQLQFKGVFTMGDHIETVCRRPKCAATIRFEVIADPPAVDRTMPIGRHRRERTEQAERPAA